MTNSGQDMIGVELLGRLCRLADSNFHRELLRVVGCGVLRDNPLFPDLLPETNEDLTGEDQSDWIDDQLYRCLPHQTELTSLGDAQFTAMQSGWSDGFQWVVFDSGEQDEFHAQNLIEPYLEWAESFSLPIMTDFDATQDEMEQHLITDFVRMIRLWRKIVIERLEVISEK